MNNLHIALEPLLEQVIALDDVICLGRIIFFQAKIFLEGQRRDFAMSTQEGYGP